MIVPIVIVRFSAAVCAIANALVNAMVDAMVGINAWREPSILEFVGSGFASCI